jgi:serine protease SohB
VVHGYGLAASQLQRLREKQIPLTVAVDKVAASGGYMMACVADKIVAAPFSIIGSIGVVAQIPNFNRFLKIKRLISNCTRRVSTNAP